MKELTNYLEVLSLGDLRKHDIFKPEEEALQTSIRSLEHVVAH